MYRHVGETEREREEEKYYSIVLFIINQSPQLITNVKCAGGDHLSRVSSFLFGAQIPGSRAARIRSRDCGLFRLACES